MTAPAIPDVEVDADLAEAIDRAPRCECKYKGQQCEAVAAWIARPRLVCCVDTAALMCDPHKATFANPFSVILCPKCFKHVFFVWERL